jgi:hypothetical protein
MELVLLLADADKSTGFVAWWGAVVATSVLVWDIYKWWTTGPRIRFIVQPDRKIMGDPELEGQTFIIFSATNFGDRPTTLESLYFLWYPNWWHRIRGKYPHGGIVKNPGFSRQFPCRLEVGERWDGRMKQSDEVVRQAKTGHFICELRHGSIKRPVRKRLLYR